MSVRLGWILVAVLGLTGPFIVWKLKGGDGDLPHWTFWVFAGAGGAAFLYLRLFWGQGGIHTPYRTEEEGFKAMEDWKWRLRKQGLKKDLEDLRRKEDSPDA
jgi:hypothetical protein